MKAGIPVFRPFVAKQLRAFEIPATDKLIIQVRLEDTAVCMTRIFLVRIVRVGLVPVDWLLHRLANSKFASRVEKVR